MTTDPPGSPSFSDEPSQDVAEPELLMGRAPGQVEVTAASTPSTSAQRREDGTTQALVSLVNDAEEKPRTSIIEALLSGVPEGFRPSLTSDLDLRAQLLTGAERPDFVLHDQQGHIVVVVEHKHRAQESCVPVKPYRDWPLVARFEENYARNFVLLPKSTEADVPHTHPLTKEQWLRDGCTFGCELHQTVPRSGGLVVPVISQLDRYRVFRRWVDELAPGLRLDKPGAAVWLLLDQRSRPLSKAAWASYTAEDGKWQTTGYDTFLPPLDTLRAEESSALVLSRLETLLTLCR